MDRTKLLSRYAYSLCYSEVVRLHLSVSNILEPHLRHALLLSAEEVSTI